MSIQLGMILASILGAATFFLAGFLRGKATGDALDENHDGTPLRAIKENQALRSELEKIRLQLSENQAHAQELEKELKLLKKAASGKSKFPVHTKFAD